MICLEIPFPYCKSLHLTKWEVTQRKYPIQRLGQWTSCLEFNVCSLACRGIYLWPAWGIELILLYIWGKNRHLQNIWFFVSTNRSMGFCPKVMELHPESPVKRDPAQTAGSDAEQEVISAPSGHVCVSIWVWRSPEVLKQIPHPSPLPVCWFRPQDGFGVH